MDSMNECLLVFAFAGVCAFSRACLSSRWISQYNTIKFFFFLRKVGWLLVFGFWLLAFSTLS